MKQQEKIARRQSGFGLLETLAGLIVFVILAMVGTKAFKGVVANQKEASQVKALTDAVSQTAEVLSAQSVAVLTQSGSKYLQWSAPAVIGSGEYQFRYRTFPNPTIQGAQDTSVVGLEVETGTSKGGVFTANRSFATLISPHLTSKNGLGQVSTAAERAAEAANYAAMQNEINGVKSSARTTNQERLNSFSCYDKGQCCGYMKKFFADPTKKPDDGVDQKCNYRCAMGGAVTIGEWKGACGMDFCAVAPWKTKEQCCSAIASGDCPSGSACAQVCIDCVGEDGSTCGPPICDGNWWNDFFDCANGTFCDGRPLPDGDVPGWGNVKALCGTPTCGTIHSECNAKLQTCCQDYWGVLAAGGTPQPKAEICATISSKAECCESYVADYHDWLLSCGADGTLVSAKNKVDGKWYCGFGGTDWNKPCTFAKGCSSITKPVGALGGGTCPNWAGASTTPWDASYPDPNPPAPPTTSHNTQPTTTTKNPASIDDKSPLRIPSIRGGINFGSLGGRE